MLRLCADGLKEKGLCVFQRRAPSSFIAVRLNYFLKRKQTNVKAHARIMKPVVLNAKHRVLRNLEPEKLFIYPMEQFDFRGNAVHAIRK
ncbi:MAG: hypothetical protein COA45_06940 [Zetaproteobacteria bacterium]|nr:MAG: hypothetical protein COA45_06940 [Zetaproteobacteria bacterium]